MCIPYSRFLFLSSTILDKLNVQQNINKGQFTKESYKEELKQFHSFLANRVKEIGIVRIESGIIESPSEENCCTRIELYLNQLKGYYCDSNYLKELELHSHQNTMLSNSLSLLLDSGSKVNKKQFSSQWDIYKSTIIENVKTLKVLLFYYAIHLHIIRIRSILESVKKIENLMNPFINHGNLNSEIQIQSLSAYTAVVRNKPWMVHYTSLCQKLIQSFSEVMKASFEDHPLWYSLFHSLKGTYYNMIRTSRYDHRYTKLLNGITAVLLILNVETPTITDENVQPFLFDSFSDDYFNEKWGDEEYQGVKYVKVTHQIRKSSRISELPTRFRSNGVNTMLELNSQNESKL